MGIIYPLLVMFLSSFKHTRDIFLDPLGLPQSLNLENYRAIFTKVNFLLYFKNSIAVTSASTLLTGTVGTIAAYALARYHFRGNRFLYFFFLSGLMMPLPLASLPLFILIKRLGLLDTHVALILIYGGWRTSFTILIMSGFFSSLPKGLEEAARVDGCTEFGVFFRVMLPLAKPGLAIALIYNAVPIWNDFFIPLIFLRSDSLSTIPLGISRFFGEYATDFGALFSSLSLAMLPILGSYLLMSKKFVESMATGAFK
jgi:raffinose/stachyose/melibiose transport system permease protein